jgi:ribonuclease R
MQFYKEYNNLENNLENTIIQKIIYEEGLSYYNNGSEYIKIENNRCIHNDIVYISDNKVVGIKERTNDLILGILYLDSKIKYGFLNDKPLYLFKPTHKAYPSFYVPYKNNAKHKVYCTINFKKWDTTDKLPVGTLQEVIGPIGNNEAEYEHLRNYYNVKNNIWKVDKLKIENDSKILQDIQSVCEDYQVFSIDPEGSLDIDDAFHYKNLENGNYEIGIHIACPIKFFENNLKDILNRVSTVYLPHRKYNMFPNNYADNYASLLEGEKRFALSLIITFDNNLNITNEIIKETIVKNIKNYNYEEFNKIYEKNDNLKNFVKISSEIFKYNLEDSHKLVENWMIFANKKVANILISRKLENTIIRKHETSHKSELIELTEELSNYLHLKEEYSASYEIYDHAIDQTHSKLGNEYYTHFTSPIRRAVDLFIHYLLIKNEDVYSKEELTSIIEKINIFTKNTRKLDRTSRRLKFLYEIKELEKNIETYCYIIKITKNRLTVYIPEYKLEEKIIIIPRKFEKNAIVEYSENNINYKLDHKEYSYSMYQKLNIRLWVFTSFENIFDKLKIEIIKS